MRTAKEITQEMPFKVPADLIEDLQLFMDLYRDIVVSLRNQPLGPTIQRELEALARQEEPMAKHPGGHIPKKKPRPKQKK